MDGGAGAPLDLRKLRYFMAVADELHFGRAAERLYITQPVLSRQIRQFERELGTTLLDRTSRRVALTPAGELLQTDGRPLLQSADLLRQRVTAPDDLPTLKVGFFVGDSVAHALRAFAQRRSDVQASLHRLYWHDQVSALHDGTVDVAFVHLPIDDDGLQLLPVRSEPRVAVVPTSHPMAAQPSVTIADLADDPVIVQRGASEAWQAFHNVDPRPDGRSPRRGPEVDNVEEKLEQVAAGTAISFVPASTAASVAHPGVRFLAVDDIPPIQVCLAWAARSSSVIVDDFVATVRAAVRRGTSTNGEGGIRTLGRG